jgi:hypothetical protein
MTKLKCINGNEDFETTRLVAEKTNVLCLVQKTRNLMERRKGRYEEDGGSLS